MLVLESDERLRHIEYVLRLFAGDDNESLMWHGIPRIHPEVMPNHELHFAVNCSDTFWWGTADAEAIVLPDDIRSLRAAKEESECHLFWMTLWVARKRNLRPMRLFYKQCLSDPEDEKMVALMNAAGPERDPASEG